MPKQKHDEEASGMCLAPQGVVCSETSYISPDDRFAAIGVWWRTAALAGRNSPLMAE